MKNYIKIGLLMVLPSLLMAQGGIRNQGATIKVSSGAQLKIVHGGILHQDDGTILNNGEIQLTKDWVQQGKYSQYLGNGTLAFVGNTNQQLSSNNLLRITRLKINNGHHLVLNNDLQVQQQLDLQNNGSVELGENNLFMESAAIISNYDNEHYIITNNSGFLQQEVANDNVHFPIGNATYNPATINNIGIKDHFRLRVIDAAQTTEQVVNRTWWVEELIKGGSLATLSLQWGEEQELANFDRHQSSINQGMDIDNSSTPAVANASSWKQTRTNLSNFSSFTVASQSALLSTNNPSINRAISSKNNFQIFPNPAFDYLNIRLDQKVENVFIQLFDSKGSLVLQSNETIGENQTLQLNNLQHLVDGVYSIQITTEDQFTFTQQFVKGQN